MKTTKIKTIAFLALMLSNNLMASTSDFKFCNEMNIEARGLLVKTRNPLVGHTFQAGIFTEAAEILENQKDLKIKGGDLASGECVSATLESISPQISLKSYKWLIMKDGKLAESKTYFYNNLDLDTTATVGDLSATMNDSMEDVAREVEAQRQLDLCTGPDECAEAEERVVTAQAQAQANRDEIDSKLSRYRGLLTGPGKLMFPIIGKLVYKKFDSFKDLLKKRGELDTCIAAGEDCSVIARDFEEKKEVFETLEKDLQNKWSEINKKHLIERQFEGDIEAQIALPSYYESQDALGNKIPQFVAQVQIEEMSHVQGVELVVDNKKLPVKFNTQNGLITADLESEQESKVFEGKLNIVLADNKTQSAEFSVKKDITKPEVKITQSGKTFFVTIQDQGQGFDGYNISGKNINISSPSVEFGAKKTFHQFQVRMRKKPASINVSATKKVLNQKMIEFDNSATIAKIDRFGLLAAPESEVTPVTTFGPLKDILEQLAVIPGQCCRSNCGFCTSSMMDLKTCRQTGYRWFKPQGSNQCFKIVPPNPGPGTGN